MPAIAEIGTEVRVIPNDDVEIVLAPGKHEFTDDRSPFFIRVTGVMKEADKIIGVFGDVTSGHQRYQGQTATLLVRLDHSDWLRDNRSAANFKVGKSVARPNGKHPFYHPEGTDIEGFPFLIRYGSLDSRRGNEPEVNSALDSPEALKAMKDHLERLRQHGGEEIDD
ncbi:hypothetical protein SBV1_970030 [Verrucomicrobia bacterium]|nr:hypothetical protein SBV1_970030 [Verrucomicrobiota bacterium]